MDFEEREFICIECGWEGKENKAEFDEELDLIICPNPKCKCILEEKNE